MIKYLDALIDKKRHIKIEHIPEARTISQNAYLWLVFTHIAFETGASKEEMYCYYLNKFPKYKEVEHLGEVGLIPITLSLFTKEQNKQFIDEVVTDARQEGFDVPDCEEKKALDMMDYYRKLGVL